MACPYFVPLEPWSDAWTGPRRVPLGEPYLGNCSHTTLEIPPDDQAKACNFGYPRNRCPHFPEDSKVDAVRFSMASPTTLIWITERDHAPVSHGTGIPLEFEALANAFLQSYLKGKSPQGK